MSKLRFQTLCVLVLLVPLPLFYLLHVQVHRYRPLLELPSRVETTLYKYNVTHSLSPAHVRRVYVKQTRLHGVKSSPKTNQLFLKKACKSRICREFLSKNDLGYFEYCWKKSKLESEVQRSQCRFINGTGRPPVALASFPGSGNTWVRGLLQQATGICTGGIYCDTTLRVSGYPGESLRSGSTLVVKTHQVDPRWTGVFYPPNTTDNYFKKESKKVPVYDAAIFLIRNPFDALVAEWNRFLTAQSMRDNHVRTLNETFFMDNPDWDKWVKSNAVIWQDTVMGWVVNNHGHRVMVVRYQDLQKDANSEVMMMLDFLEFPYTLTTVNKKLAKNYNEFHRKHSNTTSFQHFTSEQREFIKSVIQNSILLLQSQGLLEVCDIRDYLEHT